MNRILFVDDEPRVLESIENQLFDQMDVWDLEFVQGGDEGLRRLDADAFDLIVTDMRMPGVDGLQILKHARSVCPGTMRIVLSGHSEIEAAMEAIPIAHQFIAKPCRKELLIATIEQALEIRNRCPDEDVRSAMARVLDLPVQSLVHAELRELLDSRDVSLDRVSAVASKDSIVVGRIIFAANTAFFGGDQEVTTLSQAVERLGIAALRMLVRSMRIERASALQLKDSNAFRIHKHSQRMLAIARSLSPEARRGEVSIACTLHDIGVLVLSMFLKERYSACQIRMRAEGLPRCVAERLEFGVDHAELGALLTRLWHLPEEVSHAVEVHHASGASEFSAHPVAQCLALCELVSEHPQAEAATRRWIDQLAPDEARLWRPRLESYWQQ